MISLEAFRGGVVLFGVLAIWSALYAIFGQQDLADSAFTDREPAISATIAVPNVRGAR